MSELLGANTDVLERNAESLGADAERVQDIRTLAQHAMAELRNSWQGLDLVQLTDQWERQASPLLARASDSLAACAATLREQAAAQRHTSDTDARGWSPPPSGTALMPALAAMSLLSPTTPPKGGSPALNASWWKSLSPLQQRQMVNHHPDRVGNLDGVSFEARDLANRALIPVHRRRLAAERDRLVAHIADYWSRGLITNNADSALALVDDKLAALTTVEATLASAGEHQLLLLDLGKQRTEAAIANGNIQTADNVAVFVPGLGATVAGTMKASDRDMGQLQQRAEAESRLVNPSLPAAATATVAWIGYQAPQWGTDLVNPGKSVTGIAVATKGAAQLVPFLQGIGAAREQDAHLTLLGHSYGSTTAGLALQEPTGVDDVVFFGSPGIGTSHLEDLQLDDGHVYYIEARHDAVGDLGTFGIDPSHLDGVEHASARESTVVDPVTGEVRELKEVTGHSSYLLDDSTSQYNMSVVVGGVPDQRVYDRGEGVGDVLSWPIPGTY